MWRHYHTGTKALIFVIDSQDRDRIHEARVELHRILTARELQDAILLVFANKQDLDQSMTVDEVRERLQLDKFTNRVWTVQESCATSGDGLVEGLNWLAENIRNPRAVEKGPPSLVASPTLEKSPTIGKTQIASCPSPAPGTMSLVGTPISAAGAKESRGRCAEREADEAEASEVESG